MGERGPALVDRWQGGGVRRFSDTPPARSTTSSSRSPGSTLVRPQGVRELVKQFSPSLTAASSKSGLTGGSAFSRVQSQQDVINGVNSPGAPAETFGGRPAFSGGGESGGNSGGSGGGGSHSRTQSHGGSSSSGGIGGVGNILNRAQSQVFIASTNNSSQNSQWTPGQREESVGGGSKAVLSRAYSQGDVLSGTRTAGGGGGGGGVGGGGTGFNPAPWSPGQKYDGQHRGDSNANNTNSVHSGANLGQQWPPQSGSQDRTPTSQALRKTVTQWTPTNRPNSFTAGQDLDRRQSAEGPRNPSWSSPQQRNSVQGDFHSPHGPGAAESLSAQDRLPPTPPQRGSSAFRVAVVARNLSQPSPWSPGERPVGAEQEARGYGTDAGGESRGQRAEQEEWESPARSYLPLSECSSAALPGGTSDSHAGVAAPTPVGTGRNADGSHRGQGQSTGWRGGGERNSYTDGGRTNDAATKTDGQSSNVNERYRDTSSGGGGAGREGERFRDNASTASRENDRFRIERRRDNVGYNDNRRRENDFPRDDARRANDRFRDDISVASDRPLNNQYRGDPRRESDRFRDNASDPGREADRTLEDFDRRSARIRDNFVDPSQLNTPGDRHSRDSNFSDRSLDRQRDYQQRMRDQPGSRFSQDSAGSASRYPNQNPHDDGQVVMRHHYPSQHTSDRDGGNAGVRNSYSGEAPRDSNMRDRQQYRHSTGQSLVGSAVVNDSQPPNDRGERSRPSDRPRERWLESRRRFASGERSTNTRTASSERPMNPAQQGRSPNDPQVRGDQRGVPIQPGREDPRHNTSFGSNRDQVISNQRREADAGNRNVVDPTRDRTPNRWADGGSSTLPRDNRREKLQAERGSRDMSRERDWDRYSERSRDSRDAWRDAQARQGDRTRRDVDSRGSDRGSVASRDNNWRDPGRSPSGRPPAGGQRDSDTWSERSRDSIGAASRDSWRDPHLRLPGPDPRQTDHSRRGSVDSGPQRDWTSPQGHPSQEGPRGSDPRRSQGPQSNDVVATSPLSPTNRQVPEGAVATKFTVRNAYREREADNVSERSRDSLAAGSRDSWKEGRRRPPSRDMEPTTPSERSVESFGFIPKVGLRAEGSPAMDRSRDADSISERSRDSYTDPAMRDRYRDRNPRPTQQRDPAMAPASRLSAAEPTRPVNPARDRQRLASDSSVHDSRRMEPHRGPNRMEQPFVSRESALQPREVQKLQTAHRSPAVQSPRERWRERSKGRGVSAMTQENRRMNASPTEPPPPPPPPPPAPEDLYGHQFSPVTTTSSGYESDCQPPVPNVKPVKPQPVRAFGPMPGAPGWNKVQQTNPSSPNMQNDVHPVNPESRIRPNEDGGIYGTFPRSLSKQKQLQQQQQQRELQQQQYNFNSLQRRPRMGVSQDPAHQRSSYPQRAAVQQQLQIPSTLHDGAQQQMQQQQQQHAVPHMGQGSFRNPPEATTKSPRGSRPSSGRTTPRGQGKGNSTRSSVDLSLSQVSRSMRDIIHDLQGNPVGQGQQQQQLQPQQQFQIQQQQQQQQMLHHPLQQQHHMQQQMPFQPQNQMVPHQQGIFDPRLQATVQSHVDDDLKNDDHAYEPVGTGIVDEPSKDDIASLKTDSDGYAPVGKPMVGDSNPGARHNRSFEVAGIRNLQVQRVPNLMAPGPFLSDGSRAPPVVNVIINSDGYAQVQKPGSRVQVMPAEQVPGTGPATSGDWNPGMGRSHVPSGQRTRFPTGHDALQLHPALRKVMVPRLHGSSMAPDTLSEHIYEVIPGDEGAEAASAPQYDYEIPRPARRWTTINDLPNSTAPETPPALPHRWHSPPPEQAPLPPGPLPPGVLLPGTLLQGSLVPMSGPQGPLPHGAHPANVGCAYAVTGVSFDADWTDGSPMDGAGPVPQDRRMQYAKPWANEADHVPKSKWQGPAEQYFRLEKDRAKGEQQWQPGWSTGDVLNYIDGIHSHHPPKRRDNIYHLIDNRSTRAKFSESLELETRLFSRGLIASDWAGGGGGGGGGEAGGGGGGGPQAPGNPAQQDEVSSAPPTFRCEVPSKVASTYV